MLKADFGLSDKDFKASNTWVYRFCRRHQIGSRSIMDRYIGILCIILVSRMKSNQLATENAINVYEILFLLKDITSLTYFCLRSVSLVCTCIFCHKVYFYFRQIIEIQQLEGTLLGAIYLGLSSLLKI